MPGTPISTLDPLMPDDSCRGTGDASRGVVTSPTEDLRAATRIQSSARSTWA